MQEIWKILEQSHSHSYHLIIINDNILVSIQGTHSVQFSCSVVLTQLCLKWLDLLAG